MSVIKWLTAMLINSLGFITAPFIFPIAYILKDFKVFREFILWIYYDDEDEFGYDVDWFMVGRERNFFTAYKWCAIRNPAWNLQASSKLNQRKVYVFTKTKGVLQQNGNIVEPSLNANAVLKYVDENGVYRDNKGEFLSIKHSILGSQYAEFYEVESGEKYWRYSFANKINIYNLWIEFQIGYSTRPTFRLKIKNIKQIN